VLAIATCTLAIAARAATTTLAALACQATSEIANGGIHLARHTTTQALNAIDTLSNNSLRGISNRAY
jgi:hypothetical protein